MHNSFIVHVIDSLQNLPEVDPCLFFSNRLWRSIAWNFLIILDLCKKLTSRDYFHDDVVSIFILKILLHFANVRMIERFVYRHFILKKLFLIWVESIFGDNFQSSLGTCWFVDAKSYLSKRAYSNFLSYSILTSNRRRIFVYEVIRMNKNLGNPPYELSSSIFF